MLPGGNFNFLVVIHLWLDLDILFLICERATERTGQSGMVGIEERADAFEVEGMRAWGDEEGSADGDAKKT